MSVNTQGWTQRPIVTQNSFDPAAEYLAQLGAGSRRTMREALAKLADWASDGESGPHEFSWHLLGIEETTALRTRLIAALAPATTNKHLAALRGVLKQCWRQGQMTAAAYESAIKLPPARGDSPRKPKKLGPIELLQLQATCRRDGSPAGARDEALFALLYGANLRRSEAVALQLTDYNMTTGQLTVGDSEHQRRRRLTANDDARQALERWIVVRGSERGPLFNPVNKGGRIERRGLSEQAIYVACQKRAAEAGLPPMSPEDLRRAVVSPHSESIHRAITPAEPGVAGFGRPTPA